MHLATLENNDVTHSKIWNVGKANEKSSLGIKATVEHLKWKLCSLQNAIKMIVELYLNKNDAYALLQ